MAADRFFLPNLKKSLQMFSEHDQLYMHYKDNRTGYVMVIPNMDSVYGPMPFFLKFECGPKYPFEPPKCTYISTDGATIHPNLYASGYICLSILGTWDKVSWVASMNIFHVAETIHHLLNEPYPIQCEPGFEGETGRRAREYNDFLQNLVVYKLAAMGYDVPIENKETRAYFQGCLQSFLEKDDHITRIKDIYKHKLDRVKENPVRQVSMFCRRRGMPRDANEDDLQRLGTKLDTLKSKGRTEKPQLPSRQGSRFRAPRRGTRASNTTNKAEQNMGTGTMIGIFVIVLLLVLAIVLPGLLA